MVSTKGAASGTPLPLSIILDENAPVTSADYIGELPRPHQSLPGVVRKVYITGTSNGEPMLKVLYEVTHGIYSGYTAWDNVTLNNKSAFKWAPFLSAIGATVGDLKLGIMSDPTGDASTGSLVTKIGTIVIDQNPVEFAVKYRNYNGTHQTDLAGVRMRSM